MCGGETAGDDVPGDRDGSVMRNAPGMRYTRARAGMGRKICIGLRTGGVGIPRSRKHQYITIRYYTRY